MNTLFTNAAKMRDFMRSNGGTLQGYLRTHRNNYPRHQIISIFTADLRELRYLERTASN